MAVTPLVLLDP